MIGLNSNIETADFDADFNADFDSERRHWLDRARILGSGSFEWIRSDTDFVQFGPRKEIH